MPTTITVLACGHRAFGLARRSAFFAIQSIAPWRSSARKISKSAAEPGGDSAAAKRTTSKPWRSASARMAARRSGVELGIVRHRRLARHPVGQQRAEGGPRFHPHVPFRRRGILRPRNFAEIVEGGEMRRDRQIAEAAFARREIAVLLRRFAECR